jgi:GalNAc-alpha-(1->4)-GalNAc-alpha-(1->3)-diNAcBac-PP-undecaprenol alpha-1,4-N-acetyl-D-galactosaminyltransferase
MNKLCLVIPALHAGGMERVMAELAWYFSEKKDLDIHLILYGYKREIFYPIPETITVHIPDFEFDNSKRIYYTLKTLLFLRKKIKSLTPDSVLSFGEYWNSFVLLAMLGLNYPVYVSDRCQPDKDLGLFHNNLRRWLYPKAKGVIAQTQKAKEIYKTQFNNNNIRVIGNPIHLQNSNVEKTGKENIVLTVGRLINTKNHDELIKLFVRINDPDWKLVIVGGDAQKQNLMNKLERLIKELNAGDKVILTGNQSNVESYFLKSKIFAFTSSSEGFPNVIGEAQCAGLPVIAFDCVAGPSEMIANGGNGFLIPMFDYDMFYSKLKLLMEDSSLREQFGLKAVESIKKYSVNIIGERFYKFVSGDF